VETKSWSEQVPNRWLMQIRHRRIAQMLKNGRLKICESVPFAIGETRPRNTRNKIPAMFQRFPTFFLRLLLRSSEDFPFTPRYWDGAEEGYSNIFFLHLRIFLILSPA